MRKDEKKEKKYYWLKLKEDFFEEKTIKFLRTLPDGDKLVIVYLKMQLKSLKTEGLIKYDNIMPSNYDELSLILDEDVNSIKLLIGALQKLGAVEILDDGSFYMLAMQDLIGKVGESAERVRKFRERKKVEVQNIPLIDESTNRKKYNGNYYLVMERDNYKCSICDSEEDLCIHHIDGYDEKKPQNNNLNKLIVLCRKCHRHIHEGEEIDKKILEKIGYYDKCNADVTKCNTDVTKCNTDVTKCNTDVTKCNTDVTKCNTEIEIEKEIDKELEIEQQKEKELKLDKNQHQQKDKEYDDDDKNNQKENLIDFIENNLHPLVPIEYEIVSQWEDNDLTRYAIKQAVLRNARSIKYIDRVLYNYKKLGITSVQQAIEEDEKFQKQKEKPYSKGNEKSISEINSIIDSEVDRTFAEMENYGKE